MCACPKVERTTIWNYVQLYEIFCLTQFVITVTELSIVLVSE